MDVNINVLTLKVATPVHVQQDTVFTHILLVKVSLSSCSYIYTKKLLHFNIIVDIDECISNNGGCSNTTGICKNTPGSFYCQCHIGYSLANDGFTCNGEVVFHFYIKFIMLMN